MQTRHIGNNWVPLLSLSMLFLLAGAVSMVAERGNGTNALVFVLGTVPVAGVSALWLWRNPSWWLAPAKHYWYLAGGTLLAVLLAALPPFLHGAGPWLVLGGALMVYGWFEQLRLLMTVGGATIATGLLTVVIHADVWGGVFHLVMAALLAFAANKLYVLRNGRRRESQDSDPDFIGSFEEFDPDEAR